MQPRSRSTSILACTHVPDKQFASEVNFNARCSETSFLILQITRGTSDRSLKKKKKMPREIKRRLLFSPGSHLRNRICGLLLDIVTMDGASPQSGRLTSWPTRHSFCSPNEEFVNQQKMKGEQLYWDSHFAKNERPWASKRSLCTVRCPPPRPAPHGFAFWGFTYCSQPRPENGKWKIPEISKF